MSDRDMESIISSAVIATEKEIAGDAWGDEEIAHDETGNRTLEAMGDGLEGQHEPDDDEEETEGEESEGESEAEDGEGEEGEEQGQAKPAAKADEEGKTAPKTEPEPQGRVPSKVLREANERARTAEAERDALKGRYDEVGTQVKTLSTQLDRALAEIAALRQAPKPAQANPAEPAKPAQAPDLWEDPNAFFAHQTKPLADQLAQLRNDIVNQRVETNMALAHAKHGDVFAQAFEAVNKLDPKNPDDRATVQRIYASPNPGEALVAWHKRNETLREVGDDPAAYRERIETQAREKLMKDPDFRKQLVAELRGEAAIGDDGRPRTQVRLPRSLNGTPGGNRRAVDPSEHDDSDQAVADQAWR